METDPNEPMNPIFETAEFNCTAIGLTKREYFAAMAMQGMTTHNPSLPPDEIIELPKRFAQWAVRYADALINELNK